ncbi:type III secretion system inner rod subunit SctI [Pectobacterium brasiliense]|uniref:type III secretion system inner rod subunit SctI n=1 Tax=Pectobacterium brasiliense TaxID=180957 RepID=UPI001968F87D|nr:type III secretion system inner rod subunit SctI [Pectobacterium brasiliense]MBN3264698.1 type III secretion system inner rod subunit SctI [Pectobacterium brasiliense]
MNEPVKQLIEATYKELSTDNSSSFIHDQNFNNLVSSTFEKTSKKDIELQNIINILSQSPEYTSNPQTLSTLQFFIAEYSNYVSLVSTLARKGVSTIETLVKAQ